MAIAFKYRIGIEIGFDHETFTLKIIFKDVEKLIDPYLESDLNTMLPCPDDQQADQLGTIQ